MRRLQRLVKALTLTLVPPLISCSDTTAPECDGCSTAIVFGDVGMQTQHFPVRGAVVTVRVLPPGCPGAVEPLVTGAQVADDQGNYRIVLRGSLPPGVYCLQVTADPGFIYSDVGLTVVSGMTVEFRPEGSGSIDTVQVDATFAGLA